MRFAFFIAALLLAASCTCGEPKGDRAGALPDVEVTCPVCGLTFNAKEAVATRVYGGKTYYFLLEDHARAFAENPNAYLKK
jgi:YHS domain-containing protein